MWHRRPDDVTKELAQQLKTKTRRTNEDKTNTLGCVGVAMQCASTVNDLARDILKILKVFRFEFGQHFVQYMMLMVPTCYLVVAQVQV